MRSIIIARCFGSSRLRLSQTLDSYVARPKPKKWIVSKCEERKADVPMVQGSLMQVQPIKVQLHIGLAGPRKAYTRPPTVAILVCWICICVLPPPLGFDALLISMYVKCYISGCVGTEMTDTFLFTNFLFLYSLSH